ncbi:tetratricopeptide repeat protein [Kitasatospora sp. NPDC091207]|uniref:tetratricopeptide repeat protein n=1 Tax=Kitasatospora sp. NPDC091207 TaxID=3364083 RepID=UPI003801579D
MVDAGSIPARPALSTGPFGPPPAGDTGDAEPKRIEWGDLMDEAAQHRPEAAAPGVVRNDLSVGTAVSMSVVQAGLVTGGIHYHFSFPGDLATPPQLPPPPDSLALPEGLLGEEQAREVYEAACLLELEWSGGDGTQNLPRIEQLHRLAAAAGNADAMARLGLIVEGRMRARLRGERPEEPSATDAETAMRWYLRSAQLGSAFGALFLGTLYEERLGNPTEALKWYEKAADAGHQIARSRFDGLQKRLALGLGALAGRKRFDEDGPRGTTRRERGGEQPVNADSSFELWLDREWKGNEARALAACLFALADAWGGAHGEWGTLTEEELGIIIRHFSTLLPTRVTLPAVALEYQESIGDGNLRALAARLRADPRTAPSARDLTPVWCRKVRENRVEAREFTYTVELDYRDYDWMKSLLDNLAQQLRADPPEGDGLPEYLLHLRMISLELAKGRDRAVPAYSGENRWEFSVILTPEYLEVLKAHSAQYSADREASTEFQAFWKRVDDALNAAPATPFP